MKHDLSKYQLRTDLAIEALEGVDKKDGIVSEERFDGEIKITTVDVLENGIKIINKKKGRYITIEFGDIIDTSRKNNIKRVFSDELRELINFLKIKDDARGLLVGLGNNKSTPDALGPL
ncbi:MAG: GPR endopeptidase, partial [Bacilli bacterium]